MKMRNMRGQAKQKSALTHRWLRIRLLWAMALVLILTLPRLSAQAQQTSEDARLLLSSVDSTEFPNVSVKVHAVDSDGLPIAGLTAADIVLIEDNALAPAEAMTLVGDASAPLLTALVLDRSTDAASWSAIQSAASTFLDSLGADDQAALIVFGDDAQVIQDFTADKERLAAALNETQVGGSFSAVNLAVQEALDLMADRPGGRRAVVLIADRADNLAASPAAPASIPTIDELVNTAIAANATVDVFGYGANAIASTELRNLAAQTNGRRVFTTLPIELSSHLQALPALFRQGYWLRYISQLPATGSQHKLEAALYGRSAPAGVTFASTARPVQVEITRLGDGPPNPEQRVSGSLFVGIDADSSAPIVSVAFLLDGDQVITITEEMVGGIVWDTTQATPGPHLLTVAVTDEAGNTGQVETSLVVAPPLTLDVVVADDQLQIGETAVITADIESYFGDAVVEAFVGVNLVGLVSNPTGPARFEVDTNRFAPGRYALVVRARDGMGYSALNDQTIFQFTPPGDGRSVGAVGATAQPTTASPMSAWVERFSTWWYEWWPWVMAILFALFVLWLFVILVRRIRRRRDQRARRVQDAPACRILLTNAGNTVSRYHLRGEESEGLLAFRFSVDGMLLQAPTVLRAEAGAQYAAQPAAVSQVASQPSKQPTKQVKQSSQMVSTLAASSKSIFQGVGATMYTASVAVELLNGLSSFLPGALGAPLQRAAGALRQRQMSVRHAQTQLAMTTTEVRQTTGAGRELAGMATKTANKVTPAGQPVQTTTQQPVQAAPAAVYGLVSSNGAAQPAPRPASTWVETPPIRAGETLQVDVHITLLKRLGKEKHVSFRLHSRAADQENTPAQVDNVNVDLTGRK